jgi:ATP-dependent DNA ligase
MSSAVSETSIVESNPATPLNSGVVKIFPRLFKKSNTGALQFWDIFVQEKVITESDVLGQIPVGTGGEIVTIFGQLGTDKPQTSKDLVSEGKNAGKKNETSAVEQAVKEAQSKWEKQKKKGYVETKEAAIAEEVDGELVVGGLFPMLAQKYEKYAAKIKWPAHVQMKLDGMRCIAIVKNGKATLWSRTRKQITGLAHIIEELEKNFENIIFDGELYSHVYKSDFEKIISAARTNAENQNLEAAKKIQYHVYDIVNSDTFEQRIGKVNVELSSVDWDIIKPVETFIAVDESMMLMLDEEFTSKGYEGTMIRNSDGLYVQDKRSNDLQKVKSFLEEEFPIIGFEEGIGDYSGMVMNFICKMSNGKEFAVKMAGSQNKLVEYFNNHDIWKNKLLTVKYKSLTGTNGVPKHGTGKAIRDYE